MKKGLRQAAVVLVLLGGAPWAAAGQGRLTLDLEAGAAVSGYNDVRIPGDGGTAFSLTTDLRSDTVPFWRVRGEWRVAARHTVGVLAAPLRIDASGRFDRPVAFMGETFAPNTPVSGRYVFNSYRISYRYDVVAGDRWRVGLGVTGKVRDAVTRLESAGRTAEKTNVGFVPLVNFRVDRQLGSRTTLRVEGDALAAPQGRAEDVFAGVLVAVTPRLSLKAGYRLLEGGADNDEVYTFAAVHYAAVGLIWRF